MFEERGINSKYIIKNGVYQTFKISQKSNKIFQTNRIKDIKTLVKEFKEKEKIERIKYEIGKNKEEMERLENKMEELTAKTKSIKSGIEKILNSINLIIDNMKQFEIPKQKPKMKKINRNKAPKIPKVEIKKAQASEEDIRNSYTQNTNHDNINYFFECQRELSQYSYQLPSPLSSPALSE